MLSKQDKEKLNYYYNEYKTERKKSEQNEQLLSNDEDLEEKINRRLLLYSKDVEEILKSASFIETLVYPRIKSESYIEPETSNIIRNVVMRTQEPTISEMDLHYEELRIYPELLSAYNKLLTKYEEIKKENRMNYNNDEIISLDATFDDDELLINSITLYRLDKSTLDVLTEIEYDPINKYYQIFDLEYELDDVEYEHDKSVENISR